MTAPLSSDRFPPAPEFHGYTSRLATPEERRYLRRFNWIRLMRYLMFWANFVFFGAVLGMLFWLAATIFFKGDTGQGLFMSALLLILAAVYFVWWRPVLPDLIMMRPILRVPARVEVLCCNDRLTAIAHASDMSQDIFKLSTRQPLLEVPSHWPEMAFALQQDRYAEFPVEIARLPGASGKVLRLTMYNDTRSQRIDPTLRDLGNFIVRFGDLSIAREMRSRLPLLRANDSFGLFAFVTMLLGLTAAMLCWVGRDNNSEDVAKLADTIAEISTSYDRGEAVPIEALAARGIGNLRPDPEFGQRALHAAPISLREARLFRGAQSFYLTEDEFSAILRISAVFPRNLAGYGQPSAELVEEYRGLLEARVSTLGAIPPVVAQAAATLPDALIARQLRALSLRNTPDRDFVAALLPRPMIVPPTETNPYFVRPQPICRYDDALCGQRDAPVTYAEAVFTAQDDAVILQATTDLQRLAESRAELAALSAERGSYRALTICGGVVLLAAIALLSSYLADWRIRRWYRKQTGHPAD